MFLHHLSLANFRNYERLELELPAPIAILQGDNGQGKTNLLEAIYLLATTRSLRAGADRELVNWRAMEQPMPFARVAGAVRRATGELRVEIVVRADRAEGVGAPPGDGGGPAGELSKRIKVNGLPKRALDLIGLINVVMFSPQDLELVAGSPSLRRRYMDIANCQVDARYCRALQQYNRVLAQRNHLLKQIRDRQQPQETLEFWSEELARIGSYLLARRLRTVAALNQRIDGYFRRLTGTGRQLKVVYRSSVEQATCEWEPPPEEAEMAIRERGEAQLEEAEVRQQLELFREALGRYRGREMAYGVSLLGPHRDDLFFRADGIDMNVYGSRGEQRAVALALKLSEVEFMQAATGERPILLLDDVMSEFDPSRRLLLLETLGPSGQILVTATDLHPFSPEFLARAVLFRIEGGTATPLVYPVDEGYNPIQ